VAPAASPAAEPLSTGSGVKDEIDQLLEFHDQQQKQQECSDSQFGRMLTAQEQILREEDSQRSQSSWDSQLYPFIQPSEVLRIDSSSLRKKYKKARYQDDSDFSDPEPTGCRRKRQRKKPNSETGCKPKPASKAKKQPPARKKAPIAKKRAKREEQKHSENEERKVHSVPSATESESGSDADNQVVSVPKITSEVVDE